MLQVDAVRKSCSPELVRAELAKIISSSGFARNDRLSGFLRFVVEQELSGRGDELKESIIGVELLGRRPEARPANCGPAWRNTMSPREPRTS